MACRRSVSVPRPAPARVSERTRIAFRLPQSAEATIRVFDAAGRKVSERSLGVLPEGAHSLEWSAPAPGVYFVRLTADRRVVGRTIAVIR